MLKNIAVKQNRKSIFSAVLDHQNKSRYYNSMVDSFNYVLSDPKLSNDQVAKKLGLMLEENSQLVNMYDATYYTPLMNAICHSINYLDTTERIKFLLDRGADPNKYPNGYHLYTPLLLSIKDLPISYSIIKMLIKYNCKSDDKALWNSVMFGDFDTVKLLECHGGKQISDMRDEYGRTVLDCAKIFDRDEDFKYRLHRHYEQQKLKSLLKK